MSNATSNTMSDAVMMSDDGHFVKSLFRKQSAFNILALLVSTIGPIVTTILAGAHFGSEGLAIIALCSPLFLIASFFGTTISSGAQIACSVFIAKDDDVNVGKVYSAAVMLTLITAILLCAALLIFRRPLLTMMAGYISPGLSAYYTFFVLTAFLTIPVYIPLFFSRAVGRSEIGLWMTGILSGVGILASLVFIRFMGIEAIALGLTVGTAVALIVSRTMLRKYFKFRFCKELFIRQIFTYGTPQGFSRLYILFATVILNALFLRAGGSAAVAVIGVVFTLHRFNTAVIYGISQTTIPLVGVFHEEQDITSIRQIMRLAFSYGNLLMLGIVVILCVFSAQTANLFGLSESAPLVAAMPFYAVYVLILLNTSLFSSYYTAAKRIWLANAIPLMQEFSLLCVGALGLSALFGIGGIWAAFPLSGLVTLLILLAVLAATKFRHKVLTFPLLQNSRLEKEGRYISLSVEGDPAKASEAAEKISAFCEESGLSPKQTMLISLSVEEIIILILNNSKHKDFSVSLRLFLLDDVIILRIRNAGDKFDAIEYYKANIADNIEKSLEVIGMKYIVQAADKISYRQTFGVNNLVVTL